MNEQLKKRLLSLGWRAGMMAVSVIVDGLIQMLSSGQIQLSPVVVVLLGLALGEVSKAINNYLSEPSEPSEPERNN